MTDKILYTGGPNPFKGLIDYPIAENYEDSYPDGEAMTSDSKMQYKEDCLLSISKGIKIINPEMVPSIYEDGAGAGWFIGKGKSGFRPLRNGDIFPLPEGFKFVKWKNKTIKIVPKVSQPEPEESQEELWDELFSKYLRMVRVEDLSEFETVKRIEKEFTIHRKK